MWLTHTHHRAWQVGCTDVDDALHVRGPVPTHMLMHTHRRAWQVGCTDVDDALHVRALPDGRVEVGVHIADVRCVHNPVNRDLNKPEWTVDKATHTHVHMCAVWRAACGQCLAAGG